MTQPHVIRMKPHLVEKVWGGRKLARVFNKTLPNDGMFGEAWEVADLPEGQSTIDNGPLKGQPLSAAVAAWGEALVGPGRDRFPLLVKLLDARRDLSIQVHPGPAYAAVHPGTHSKDESWVILDVDLGGKILMGMRAPTDATRVEDAVQSGRILEQLNAIAVQKGEVYRVAPGCVHAICAGVALLEIQEPSDTTFRVYDYDRPGLDGQPRALHLRESLEVMSYNPTPASPASARVDLVAHNSSSTDLHCGQVLVLAPTYRIESATVLGELTWPVDPRSPQVIHVLEGAVRLGEVEVGAHQTAVVPACHGRVVCRGDGRLIGATAGPPVFDVA